MSFDWTAFILFKQVSALKEELDKIDMPLQYKSVDAAKGPAVTFNNILPQVETILSKHEEFSRSIDFLNIYELSGMFTAQASQLRAEVGVLLQTLEAFIQATYPSKEKKQIGFI